MAASTAQASRPSRATAATSAAGTSGSARPPDCVEADLARVTELEHPLRGRNRVAGFDDGEVARGQRGVAANQHVRPLGGEHGLARVVPLEFDAEPEDPVLPGFQDAREASSPRFFWNNAERLSYPGPCFAAPRRASLRASRNRAVAQVPGRRKAGDPLPVILEADGVRGQDGRGSEAWAPEHGLPVRPKLVVGRENL
jgi:hypothetical protein